MAHGRPPQAWAAFMVALGLRLFYVAWYPQIPVGLGDDRMYDQVAMNLAGGRGFTGGFAGQFDPGGQGPEIGIGPVYPAVLAAVYLTAGHSIVAVRLLQAVLGALVVLWLFPVAVRAFGPAAARWAAWLWAVYPGAIVYTGMVLTETIFVFTLAWLTWMVWRAMERPSVCSWSAAGAVLGLTILLRAEMLLVLPWYAVLAWRCAYPRRVVLSLLCCGAVALTVGGWTARNYAVFKKPILVSAHGGEILWISTTDWTEWRYDDPQLASLIRGKTFLEQNATLGREGMRRILADPVGYLWLCAKRLPYFWVTGHTTYLAGLTRPYAHYARERAYGRLAAKVGLLMLNLGLVAAGWWGLWRVFTGRSAAAAPWSLFLAPALTIAIVHTLLFAAPRYQMPMMVFVLMFSAVGLQKEWAQLRVMRAAAVAQA